MVAAPSLAVDISEVTRFLELLDKDTRTARFRAFLPASHPDKARDRGRKGGFSNRLFNSWQTEGRGCYMVVGNGGDLDRSITDVPALFVEWDDRPIPWQQNAWRELRLPEPTFMVATGGKSVHCYWVLHRPIAPDHWRAITSRLIAHCKSDRSCCNPSRVMRLPGSHYLRAYGTSAGVARIINETGSRYWPEDIDELVSPEETPPAAAPPPAPPAPAPAPAAPAGTISSFQTVALEDLLPRSLRLLAAAGAPSGSRNADAFRLAATAHALIPAAVAEGLRVDGTLEQLLHAFASRCSPPLDDQEIAATIRSATGTARTPDPGWPNRLAWIHRRQQSPDTRPQPRPVTADPGTTAPPPVPEPPEGGTTAKPLKVEAGELLTLLRQKGGLRFNTFTQNIELNEKQIEGSDRYYLKLAQVGIKASKDLALDCLVEVAKENPYDPVREYLEWCENNCEPEYIGGIASGYLRPNTQEGLDNPTLYDHMIRCTMIGAVQRAFQPGWKHDTACVLLGAQGARKSTFWRILGGPFFSDGLGDISSKDDLMILHRSWIMEWAELDHIMGRRHAGQIKNFLSQSSDVFRVPYGKATNTFPRRGIIVGSTNRKDGFLLDDTGSRRFWVIPTTCTKTCPIDCDTLANQRDSLWAGAMAEYRKGAHNYLPSELEEKIETENDLYRIESVWTPAVLRWLQLRGNQPGFTSADVLTEAIDKPIDRQTRADQMEVGGILSPHGWSRRQVRVDGVKAWRWYLESQGGG